MNNLGNEVTIKVKEAIRTKLKEMKANSSDEIIDYIMLLATTKKTSEELAKSIDFVMENNTIVFVKWLSTIIKKLQQVTISTAKNDVSDNPQVLKTSTVANEKFQNEDILICEANDIKFDDSDAEKEELMFDLGVNEDNIQTFNREKEVNTLPELKVSKYDKSKISSSYDRLKNIKEKISFSSIEANASKINVQINKQSINEKSCNKMKNTSLKNDSKVISNLGVVSKQNHNAGTKTVDCKRKRPRISINSDDEDEKNIRLRSPITIEEPAKQKKKEPLQKIVNKSISKFVVVNSLESKKDVNETKKKLFMHDLIEQRVDHQRGALALDTAFKYVQQQISASDKEISVIKKWRDYAVEMLRSSKKV